MSFIPQVIADDSGQWCSNALYFATEKEAEAYVFDLMMRWTLVRDTRVVESPDPVKNRWVDGRLVFIEDKPPFDCPLCGQHITDGKPCGCGAR
jgi:hypothetical protein